MKNKIIVYANQKRIVPVVWTGKEKELNFGVVLSGKGAGISMPITLMGKNNSNISIRIEVIHRQPDTTSSISIKGALWNKSTVNVYGNIKIEKGAKGANASLGVNLLLLSEQAVGIVNPNLEISENEVKAGHAVTIGKVNEDELFYLMSRGLSQKAATNLIVEGFLKQ
jgi:Fe-S cluster assembly protein SufD